jgi:hypothetical protein
MLRTLSLVEWEIRSVFSSTAAFCGAAHSAVEHIRKSAECSILFFTNSVQHAEEMSARLNLAGISAAAVSGIALLIHGQAQKLILAVLEDFERLRVRFSSTSGRTCLLGR